MQSELGKAIPIMKWLKINPRFNDPVPDIIELARSAIYAVKQFIEQWNLQGPMRRQNISKQLSETFDGDELLKEVVNSEAKQKQEEIKIK